MSYRLDNVERRGAEHGSFEILPRDVRSCLVPGDFAKLIFLNEGGGGEPSGERMWVKLTGFTVTDSGPVYRGTLNNNPAFIKSLRLGDPVEFRPEHVADIEVPK